jgi:hypothetical protein
LGYVNSGDWANYTRDFPAGKYYIWKRGTTPTASQAAGSMAVVTSGWTTTSQTVSNLGTFDTYPVIAGYNGTGGWENYQWTPLRDPHGNIAKYICDGTQQTQTLRGISGGGMNVDMYLLTPVDPTAADKPYVWAFTPDGSTLYQPSNKVTFTVISLPGVTKNSLNITLDGFTPSSVTYGGTANALTVAFPVPTNSTHTVSVIITDANATVTNSFNFATFNPTGSVSVETEDYDFGGGQFITFANWYRDCYSNYSVANFTNHVTGGYAITNIDWGRNNTQTGGTMTYRYGIPSEICSDTLTASPLQAGQVDYDSPTYSTAGDWMNFTRDYPAGTYNVFVRAATYTYANRNVGYASQVVAGLGTTNQTLVNVGNFDTFVNPTGSWQTYQWAVLRDTNGNPAKFVTDGSAPQTLRLTQTGGVNWNFFTLVPVNTGLPTISNVYPDGSWAFQQTNVGTFTLSSTAGINSNTIALTLNGVAVTNFSITGNANNWVVTYALAKNASYTVAISCATADNGFYSKTYNFDTYSSTYYTWEAEDWDFTVTNSDSSVSTGQFFDNPQVCAYMNTFSTSGKDFLFTDSTAGATVYRPLVPWTAANHWWFTCTAANDLPRPQFPGTSTNNTDYNVGYWADGSWAHYTRHYPAGTYNVMARMKEGNGPVPCTLSKVAAPTGTGEATTLLGSFYPTNAGNFNSFQNVMLVDANTNLATITLDGSQTTLRFDSTMNSTNNAANGDSINITYFMLIPAGVPPPTKPTLTATINNGQIMISFPTQAGHSYQVQSQSVVNGPSASWTAVGANTAGTGSTVTISDSLSASAKFYEVVVTTP